VYDTVYNSSAIDLLVPSIVTGHAEEMGQSLGSMCADVRKLVQSLHRGNGSGLLEDGSDVDADAGAGAGAGAGDDSSGAGTGTGAGAGAGAGGDHDGNNNAGDGDGDGGARLSLDKPSRERVAGMSARILERSVRSLHFLEDFLGHPRGYFHGSADNSAMSKLFSVAKPPLQRSLSDSTRTLDVGMASGSSQLDPAAPFAGACDTLPSATHSTVVVPSSGISVEAGTEFTVTVQLCTSDGVPTPWMAGAGELQASITGCQPVKVLVRATSVVGQYIVDATVARAGLHDLIVQLGGQVRPLDAAHAAVMCSWYNGYSTCTGLAWISSASRCDRW